MINICLLGATGSIGQNALDVLRLHPSKFRLRSITANTDVEGLVAQIAEFEPDTAVIADSSLENKLWERVSSEVPQSKVKILLSRSLTPAKAASRAASVQLSGVPSPITASAAYNGRILTPIPIKTRTIN